MCSLTKVLHKVKIWPVDVTKINEISKVITILYEGSMNVCTECQADYPERRLYGVSAWGADFSQYRVISWFSMVVMISNE